MKSTKPILVVPKGSVTEDMRKEILKAGYLLIETDSPDKVKVMGELDSLSSDILSAALMSTVKTHTTSTYYTFAQEIMKRIKAAPTA